MSMVKAVEFWAATMESAESATTAVTERIVADADVDWDCVVNGRSKIGSVVEYAR